MGATGSTSLALAHLTLARGVPDVRFPRFAFVLALLPACAATKPIVHEAWTGAVPTGGGAAAVAVPEPTTTIAAEPSAPAPAQDTDESFQEIALHVGLRKFDDDWDPIEEHLAFALEYVTQNAGSVVGFEGGVSYSADDDDISAGGIDFDLEAEVWEVYLGLHKSFFDVGPVRPYVGAGLSYLTADVEISGGGASADDDDDVFGFYVRGGVGMDISESLEIGADVRAAFLDEIDALGQDVESDYLQGSVFLGLKI
jgi:opacity protein-like surface antigen